MEAPFIQRSASENTFYPEERQWKHLSSRGAPVEAPFIQRSASGNTSHPEERQWKHFSSRGAPVETLFIHRSASEHIFIQSSASGNTFHPPAGSLAAGAQRAGGGGGQRPTKRCRRVPAQDCPPGPGLRPGGEPVAATRLHLLVGLCPPPPPPLPP